MASMAKFLLCFIPACPSFAATINSLQTGPVGPGYVWGVIDDRQSESAVSVGKTYGYTTWDNTPVERLDAQTYLTQISTATAFKPSKDFVAMISAMIKNSSHSQTMRIDNSSYTSRSAQYELMFRSVLDREKWVGGVSAGIFTLGEENKKLSYAGKRRTLKLASSTLPILEFTGGARYFSFETLAKFRLYSSELSEASSNDMQGTSRTFDIIRSSPANINLATAWNGLEKLMLVLELNYQALGQIADNLYQYSSVFTPDLRQIAGGSPKTKGKWDITAGGKFFPSSDFSIRGAITFETSSATASKYYSHELENLSGWSIDGGCELITRSDLRAGLNFGYKIPRKVSNNTRPIDPNLEMEIPRPENMKQNIYSARWDAALSSTWSF